MAKSSVQKEKDFRRRFLEEYRGCPRAKMVDLEVDGLRPHNLLKNGISAREGVYEFELFRRDCVTTEEDWDGKLTSSLLVQVLYGLGFPDRHISRKRKVSRLNRWLVDFKRIGSKYGDYAWLDDRKIIELIKKTLGLIGQEISLELEALKMTMTPMEAGEPDEMRELREIFKDCALTEDEAEALGFGPGPHFPEP